MGPDLVRITVQLSREGRIGEAGRQQTYLPLLRLGAPKQ